MKYKLDDIISDVMKDIPKEVGLKLPKLNINDKSLPKTKIPKIKV